MQIDYILCILQAMVHVNYHRCSGIYYSQRGCASLSSQVASLVDLTKFTSQRGSVSLSRKLVQLGRIFKVNYHCNHYLLYTHRIHQLPTNLCITCLASYIANSFHHSTLSFIKLLSHANDFSLRNLMEDT